MFQKDDYPIPLSHIDVHIQTKRKPWIYLKRLPSMIIGTWLAISHSLSEPWIGVTRFALLHTNPPEGYMWFQARLTKNQVTTRPGSIWPEEWFSMSKGSQRNAINKGAENNHIWTRQENNEAITQFRTMFLILKNLQIMPEDNRRQGGPQRCIEKSRHPPIRTVPAGGERLQVDGLRWKRKD